MEEQVGINNGVEPKKRTILGSWKNLISGDFLASSFVRKQRNFLLFLFVLSLIYISNRHIFARTIRDNAKLRKEAAKSKAKYVTKSAELVRLRKRSNILNEIEKRKMDLVESSTPPMVIKK